MHGIIIRSDLGGRTLYCMHGIIIRGDLGGRTLYCMHGIIVRGDLGGRTLVVRGYLFSVDVWTLKTKTSCLI